MKAALAVALVGTLVTVYLSSSYMPTAFSDDRWETEFTQFITEHGKNYEDHVEYRKRMDIFKQNFIDIDTHNRNNDGSYARAVNHMTDLTEEEIMAFRMGFVEPKSMTLNIAYPDNYPETGAVDWVSQGVVHTVKDQKSCGSCWAFSAAGAMESAYAISHPTNEIIDIPEQEFVDCVKKSSGCRGGWMDYAFEYSKTHDLCTEAEYPYHAKNEKCHDTECTHAEYRVESFTNIPKGDAVALNSALQNQPIAVAVDASKWSSYSSGVFTGCSSKARLNHGVLLVGVDAEGTWTIKNSWGPRWGENGFMRIAAGNSCGIADRASYPTIVV